MRDSSVRTGILVGLIILIITDPRVRMFFTVLFAIGFLAYVYDSTTENVLPEDSPLYSFSAHTVRAPDFSDPSQSKEWLKFIAEGEITNNSDQTLQRFNLVSDLYDCPSADSDFSQCQLLKVRNTWVNTELAPGETYTFREGMLYMDVPHYSGVLKQDLRANNVGMDSDAKPLEQRALEPMR